METQYYLGAPSTTADRYFNCEWCCAGFSGPPIEKPACPRCERTGQGVYEVDPKWVERRLDEQKAVAEETARAEELGLIPNTHSSAHAERIRKIRQPFRQGGLDEMPKTATKDAKPKAAPKVKEKHPCACGCDGETFGTWVPGHDAKFYSARRKAENGDITMAEFEKMFPKDTIRAMADKGHK